MLNEGNEWKTLCDPEPQHKSREGVENNACHVL